MDEGVTIIIPAYNEEKIIKKVIDSILDLRLGHEIIVVDDGSSDTTYEKAKETGIKVIQHHMNFGYGAALKTGAKNAKNGFLIFFDGDGQHNPNHIVRLTEKIGDNDLVMGARTNLRKINLFRMPGRFLLKKLVKYLADFDPQDINSGFMAVRRELFLRYAPVLSDGFSCSTTLLLTMLQGRQKVIFTPVEINKRIGKSSVKIFRDGFNTIISIIRIIALFNPLRIFVPLSVSLFVVGIVYGAYKLFTVKFGLPIGALLMLLSGIIIFLFGIICDQISSLRLEKYKKDSPPTL